MKLLDLDAEEPAHADNPFSAVIAAHTRALETRRDPSARLRWKTEIVRSLYMRGFDRQQVVDLFRFIHWVMRLPVELDAAFHQTVEEIEEKLAMPYVTSFERVARERGRGLGRIEVLRRLLMLRFGPLPD